MKEHKNARYKKGEAITFTSGPNKGIHGVIDSSWHDGEGIRYIVNVITHNGMTRGTWTVSEQVLGKRIDKQINTYVKETKTKEEKK